MYKVRDGSMIFVQCGQTNLKYKKIKSFFHIKITYYNVRNLPGCET